MSDEKPADVHREVEGEESESDGVVVDNAGSGSDDSPAVAVSAPSPVEDVSEATPAEDVSSGVAVDGNLSPVEDESAAVSAEASGEDDEDAPAAPAAAAAAAAAAEPEVQAEQTPPEVEEAVEADATPEPAAETDECRAAVSADAEGEAEADDGAVAAAAAAANKEREEKAAAAEAAAAAAAEATAAAAAAAAAASAALQWAAEGHELDKKTGEMMAYAVCFENQRWYPLKGWTSKLLPTDRHKWSSEDGAWQRQREEFPVPAVWGHPAEECEWRDTEWRIDANPRTDPAGWEYALSFGSHFSGRKSGTECVRRRAWRRAARVQEAFFGERASAKGSHTIKCACLTRVTKQEEARYASYTKETLAKGSLRAAMVEAAEDLKKTCRSLQNLSENTQQLARLHAQFVGTLKRAHQKDFVEPSNAACLLYNRLNQYVLRHIDHTMFQPSGGTDGATNVWEPVSITGTRSSLSTMCTTVDSTCASLTSACRRTQKKVEKANTVAATSYESLKTAFAKSRVGEATEVSPLPGSDASADMWAKERQYATEHNAFVATFETYKQEVLSALRQMDALQTKALDLLRSAGEGYAAMLSSTGFGEAHEVARCFEITQEDGSLTAHVPTREYADVGEREAPALIDPLESQLVHRVGILKSKGLVSFSTYLVVLTVDAHLYLFEQPATPETPLGQPQYSLDVTAHSCDAVPHQESGPGCFTVVCRTAGLLGKSDQTFTFKATTEEEMVDWGVALKHVKEGLH